jgi:hypothetical protein
MFKVQKNVKIVPVQNRRQVEIKINKTMSFFKQKMPFFCFSGGKITEKAVALKASSLFLLFLFPLLI